MSFVGWPFLDGVWVERYGFHFQTIDLKKAGKLIGHLGCTFLFLSEETKQFFLNEKLLYIAPLKVFPRTQDKERLRDILFRHVYNACIQFTKLFIL